MRGGAHRDEGKASVGMPAQKLRNQPDFGRNTGGGGRRDRLEQVNKQTVLRTERPSTPGSGTHSFTGKAQKPLPFGSEPRRSHK